MKSQSRKLIGKPQTARLKIQEGNLLNFLNQLEIKAGVHLKPVSPPLNLV